MNEAVLLFGSFNLVNTRADELIFLDAMYIEFKDRLYGCRRSRTDLNHNLIAITTDHFHFLSYCENTYADTLTTDRKFF
ncbi:hypothetical protein D910_03643 [Dendroctonus ponderosae]|uniref:Uncharacterized protein n=1 Tax=Dendroctonus ponderosae TaxID=77166 RepID=U4TZG9_DENPD|nr:hypothetical protein D910_03643 [Dendroctonus ponderosae]